ncbi:hypothetical protein ACFY1P_13835 [Streptomyces sp. NPDC001407]|uniref:hypothetical protein n=1 Tax=Streptomyces sp. NPDC001407 TaxID=3364573 RepID=UPI003685E333
MYKRLPMLALCLAVTTLGVTACDASGDSHASASATPTPTPAATSESPSPSPAEARVLTGLLRAGYLRIIRTNYSDLDGISDDALVDHGNAFCAAHGQALADQAKKTMKELAITPKQTTQIMGTAHGVCR